MRRGGGGDGDDWDQGWWPWGRAHPRPHLRKPRGATV